MNDDQQDAFEDRLDTLCELCLAGMKMALILFFIPLWVPLVFLGVLYNQLARKLGKEDAQRE